MTMIIIRMLMGLEAIVCLLLIGIVLIQRSKGQGVGLSFGGGAEAVFGAQMGNVLTRTTVVLGVIFLLNTAVLAVLKPTQRGDSLSERMAPRASEAVQAPAPTAEDLAAALGPDAIAPAPEASDAAVTDVEVVEPTEEAVAPVTEAVAPSAEAVEAITPEPAPAPAPAVVVPAEAPVAVAPSAEAFVVAEEAIEAVSPDLAPAVEVPAQAPAEFIPADVTPVTEAPAEAQ